MHGGGKFGAERGSNEGAPNVRREPRFDTEDALLELDFAGARSSPRPPARGKGKRIEPSIGVPDQSLDLRAVHEERLSAPMDRRAQSSDASDDAVRPARRDKRGKRAAKPGKPRSFLGRLFYWGFVLTLWALIAGGGLVAYYATQLPPIDQLAVPKRPPNIAILAQDGTLLANRGDTGGAAVSLKELPPYLPKAFIAIEDRRFYSHMGVDPLGILRAVIRDLTGRGAMEGGSTLTQQLAKNLFLTQERTLSRKIQEAILAIWLERKYSKDQILELYLNRVYFGSGAYGVEAAARKYFGKSARNVTLAEAAVLAGLMKAPSKLAPNRNPEGATGRAAQVIDAMLQEGFITEAMAKAALAHPAEAVRQKGTGSFNYAADYVVDALDDTLGEVDEDIIVTTTFDARMQSAAEKALDEELAAKGAKFGVSQGALVALDPNGGIKALVGGRDYADSQFDRAVAAKRQPGSAFKPFVYLTALENGLTPETVRIDKPLNIRGWQPENYTHDYRGPVTLTKALALSINSVAVQLGLEVGPKNVAATAHRLGIQSDLEGNASLALGTSAVTPLEIVTAYAAFANGGIGVQAHAITKITTAKGKLLYQRKGSAFGRLIEPQYVAMMNTMLEETLSGGTARKADLPGWQAAGKTGTSQDYRDAWFIGYTGRLIAGVWLGNDDNSPTRRSSGGNLPVDIWSRFMRAALQGVSPTGLPGGTWTPPVTDSGPAVSALAPGQYVPARERSADGPMTLAPPVPTAPLPAPANVEEAPAWPPAQPLPPSRRDPSLVPPASIPNAGEAPAGPSLFERLFGG